jgi:hypothetical protein
VKPFKIRIPTRQDGQTPDRIIDPNMDLWFTDGSGIHDCFGAGIFGLYEESIPMGSLSTVFSTEVMGILRCTELLTKNCMRRRIHICCDSRAAVVALLPNHSWFGNVCTCWEN